MGKDVNSLGKEFLFITLCQLCLSARMTTASHEGCISIMYNIKYTMGIAESKLSTLQSTLRTFLDFFRKSILKIDASEIKSIDFIAPRFPSRG